MENRVMLTKDESLRVKGGAAVAIGTVAAVLAIAILAVVVWKMYTSSKGEVTLPGGFKFEWAAGLFKNLFARRLK